MNRHMTCLFSSIAIISAGATLHVATAAERKAPLQTEQQQLPGVPSTSTHRWKLAPELRTYIRPSLEDQIEACLALPKQEDCSLCLKTVLQSAGVKNWGTSLGCGV